MLRYFPFCSVYLRRDSVYLMLIMTWLFHLSDMAMAEENLTMTLAVASSVAVFMFAVLIGVIIVGITW